MQRTAPTSKFIIGYRDFYQDEPPTNRIGLLDGLCKKVIIGEIAALKYRLKPKERIDEDLSFSTQQKELKYFCGSIDSLFKKYAIHADKYVNGKDFPLIFTRQMCLFAMEEIINSSLPIIPGFTMAYSWEALLKYILSVNNEITKLTGPKNRVVNSQLKESEVLNLETLNPKLIPLNELSISTDALYIIYRGYHLLNHLFQHEKIGKYFHDYMQAAYDIPFDKFIYEVACMYTTNNRGGLNDITNEITGEKIDASFYYSVFGEGVFLFDALSRSISNENPERLLTIKKYPFYKESSNVFILTDNILLVDKCYYQFINDFWFDKIKNLKSDTGKDLFPIDTYRSFIGYFFESYIDKLFKEALDKAKYYIIRTFGDLIVRKNGENIELADIYIRSNSKVFIAQVKSTGLYDTEKYGGDINKLYKNGRVKFFQSFGIDQLVESIKNLNDLALQIDPKFPKGKSLRIYPALVLNEKAMQTPFMAQIFNQRFNELINPIRTNKMSIFPLTLIHISDVEQMKGELYKNPNVLWDILDFNRRNSSFIPPFYNTLNKMDIRPNYKDIEPLYKELIGKYHIKLATS